MQRYELFLILQTFWEKKCIFLEKKVLCGVFSYWRLMRNSCVFILLSFDNKVFVGVLA